MDKRTLKNMIARVMKKRGHDFTKMIARVIKRNKGKDFICTYFHLWYALCHQIKKIQDFFQITMPCVRASPKCVKCPKKHTGPTI